jgi:Ras-related GTP-binding protein C/D
MDLHKAFLFDVISKIYIATDSAPVDIPEYEICSDFIDVVIDISDIYGYLPGRRPDVRVFDRKDRLDETETSSIIHMTGKKESKTPDRALYLREINKYLPLTPINNNRCLALILIMPKETLLDHGLLEYNVQRFKDAILSIFGLQEQ